MGAAKSQLTDQQLQDYQDLTYFTKKEVLYAYQKFEALSTKNSSIRTLEEMKNIPELKANPFGDRICKVFSSTQDGNCTFEDYLDMMSVFSDAAPKSVKAEHAFRIFDFDGDDMLGTADLRQVITALTKTREHSLTEEEIKQLIQYVLAEADLDDDGSLSFAEFEHIIEKSSDFSKTFRIHL
ncbi:hypothetical protein TKK_0013136 [Trichogramma kaykai]|uniref:EF-hand domain-containing protein n=1 Tax=Trichogramma kaykai TaxID=54128 RepID=A0ABD2WKN7_9HYME